MPAAHERIFPTRDILKAIYTFLSGLRDRDDRIPYGELALTRRFSREMGHVSRYTMECALCIFCELALIAPLSEGGFQFIPPAGKVELMNAPTFRQHEERKGDM